MKKSFETYNPSEFVQGCTIDLGMWELEIGNTLPISDYTSGRVFLSTAQPDILLTNQIITFLHKYKQNQCNYLNHHLSLNISHYIQIKLKRHQQHQKPMYLLLSSLY